MSERIKTTVVGSYLVPSWSDLATISIDFFTAEAVKQ
jgi:hypothetical protein